jgi:pimeloyl-ACP methyl ester carboxylesterase
MGRDHSPGGTAAAVRPAKRLDRVAALPDGAALHYVEQGQGESLVLLHGGIGDLHSWDPHLPLLARRYRTFAFSRRHAYPNANGEPARDYGASQDARDLASLLETVRSGPCHLVGSSYGGLVALVFALSKPSAVRSLCLFEPPLHAWARDHIIGKALYEQFMEGAWQPARVAFESGDDACALRLLMSGMGHTAPMAADAMNVPMRNSHVMRALTAAEDPFPHFPREAVAAIWAPVLLLRGERGNALHALVIDELAHVLRDATRVVLPAAGHAAPFEHPRQFVAVVVRFLRHLRSVRT